MTDRSYPLPRTLTPERLGLYGTALASVWLLICLGAMAKGWWMVNGSGQPLLSNFLCLWASGRLALTGLASASYDWQAIGQIELAASAAAPAQAALPWFYPPTFLLATAPLALLPYVWSCAVWLLLTGIGYVAVVRAILPHRLTVVLALAAPPVFINLVETETGFAVAALIGIALLLLEARPALAGVALGVLTFKPQLGLLFPLILRADSRWRAFSSAAATAILLAALSASLFGPDAWSAFLHATPATLAADAGGDFAAWDSVQTWYSFASFLGASPVVAWSVYALTAGCSAGAICWLWRAPVSYNLKAAAASVGVLLVTPYVMSYDMVVLVVAVAFLIKQDLATGFRRGDLAVYLLVLFAPLYPMIAQGLVPLLPLTDSLLLAWILRRAVNARTPGQ